MRILETKIILIFFNKRSVKDTLQDKFIMEFKEKAESFNDFFTWHFSLVNNKSQFPSTLTKKTCKSLSTVEFSAYDILKIIGNPKSKKLHGHDMASIQMFKICDESICKPNLGMIIRSCLENRKLPSELKKANVVTVFKKIKKQEATTKEILPHFFTASFKQNI